MHVFLNLQIWFFAYLQIRTSEKRDFVFLVIWDIMNLQIYDFLICWNLRVYQIQYSQIFRNAKLQTRASQRNECRSLLACSRILLNKWCEGDDVDSLLNDFTKKQFMKIQIVHYYMNSIYHISDPMKLCIVRFANLCSCVFVVILFLRFA